MLDDLAFRQLMTQPLLAQDAPTACKALLKARIPAFQAPTDPLAYRQAGARLRQAALTQVYLRGWPKEWLAGEPAVIWGETLTPHPAYRIRKLCYQIHPRYWVPAALYEPTGLSGPAPVMLNPNGHHRGGKAADYKQLRCINLAKRGCLALNFEFIGMSELEADCYHGDLIYQDLTGVAGVGFFYQAMKRGLDVMLAHPHADPKRVGMTGLSGGGWQTIVLSALDERITLSVPVAGYTAIRARIGCPRDIGDLEQAPPDLTTVLDYQDLTALLAPRPTLLILNENDDCCFKTADAKPVIYDAVQPTFAAFGAADKFAWYSNTQPGTHNYDADNRAQLYAFLARHWGLSGPSTDIASDSELQSERALLAGLPPEHTPLRELAYQRGQALVAAHPKRFTATAAATLRQRVRQVLRLPLAPAGAPEIVLERADHGAWRLPGEPLPTPISGLWPAKAETVTLVLGDTAARSEKRMPAKPAATEALFAMDLLGVGELAVDQQHLMLYEATGGRLLGARVAQILAAADFASQRSGVARVDLRATGFSACAAAVIAVALAPGRFRTLWANEMPVSFLRFLEWGWHANEVSLALGVDLLPVADIPQFLALFEDVTLLQPGRNVPSSQPGLA